MQKKTREQGTILIVCLILSVLVLGLMAAGVTVARASGSWFEYTVKETEVLALAEAGTELRQKDLITELADFTDDATLLGNRSYNITKGSQTYTVTTNVTREPISGTSDNELQITDSDGVAVFVSYYKITGRATVKGNPAQVTRTIQVGRSPLFQFAVFYDGDCEILPGPSMTLAGRVHANGDIYLGCGGTLTIDSSYLRCTGEIFRERKDKAATTGGTIRIREAGSSTYRTLDPSMAPATRWNGNTVDPHYYGNYSDDADSWVNFADNRWGGTVQTQAHGVKEVAAPQFPALDPGGHYHNSAGLVIESDGSSVTAKKRVGGSLVDVTSSLPPGTLSMNHVYDAREGQILSVVEVDMKKLRDSGEFPDDGPSRVYVERCLDLLEHPPDQHWDAVTDLW